MQDPRKFTHIEIFGLKIYHLATLAPNWSEDKFICKQFLKDAGKKNIRMRPANICAILVGPIFHNFVLKVTSICICEKIQQNV
jgi:hypothetical protein